MLLDPKISARLRDRIEDIRQWLADEAPYISGDQKHLDEHTPERAYWHHGYQAALTDVLDLTDDQLSQTRGTEGKSS